MTTFAGFTDGCVAKGYSRNPCRPDACHDDMEHAHLRTPDGEDVLVWANGTWSGYDLTQPARCIYPIAKGRR